MSENKAKKVIAATAAITGASYAILSVIAKKKKPDSIYENNEKEQNPMEGKKVVFVEDDQDKENADGKKGHLEATGSSDELRNKNFYEKHVKRGLDKALSFGGLVLLSPLMGAIALAIKVEDPGPVLFTQKRVGENKQYFKLHKFRSMKMSTPHDVPTHMLDNPDQYITKVGKFIRAHSLDELPQIWDIFIGNMSVIGPRPALWNQDVLVSERDKYGANDVKPGLTGWAQINGRDELEIPEKAKLDGVYTKELEKNSLDAIKMDAKCFAGSVGVFAKDDTVVEGGTGELAKEHNERENVPADDPKEYFGCDYAFHVDTKAHKNVLVIGKGSYIGETFVKYAKEHYKGNFTFRVVDTLPKVDGTSELDHLTKEELSQFDIVYHLAGIAHADVGHVDDATKEKYYKVNTDLAIHTAKRYKDALKDANKQGLFVLMSSMIVYGDSAPYGKERIITEETIPSPANFYGDSKWQADKGVRALADDSFNVAVIRPPMIYGKGSKGNYPTLAKLAKKLPVFPDVDNVRSMLYIGNLCEFLSQLFISSANKDTPNALIFMPQNAEYTKTADMVKEIADVSNHNISVVKVLNPAVVLADYVPGKISGLVDKAFGNNTYDELLSNYKGLDYQKYSLSQSIEETEGKNDSSLVDDEKPGLGKKVLIVASVASMIDQFNKPNIEVLQSLGYDVDVATNFRNPGTITLDRCKELLQWLNDMKVDSYQIDFDRNVSDIKADQNAFKQLDQVFKGQANAICDIDAETRLTVQATSLHTEKKYAFMHCHSPIGGVIGRLVAHKNHVKAIYTAHGFHFYDGAPLKNWLIFYPIEKELSRITDILITINKEDYNRAKKKFHAKKVVYIPGVGIDVDKFAKVSKSIDKSAKRKELGISNDDVMLLSVGELNANKNHIAVVRAIGQLQNEHKVYNQHLVYCIAGKGEKREELKRVAKQENVDISLLGFRSDVSELLAAADLYILPSIREGLNVSLMEAMASGKPCLASKIRGNVDLIDDSKGGYLFNPTNDSLVSSMAVELEKKNKWNLQGKYNKKKAKLYNISIVKNKYIKLFK